MKATPAAVELDADARRFYYRPRSIRFRREVLPGWVLSLAIVLPLLSLFIRPGPHRLPLRVASFTPLAVLLIVHIGRFGVTTVDPEAQALLYRSKRGRRRKIPYRDVAAFFVAPVEAKMRQVSVKLETGETLTLADHHYYGLSVTRAAAALTRADMQTEGKIESAAMLHTLRRMIGCRPRYFSYLLRINKLWYRTFDLPKRRGGTRQIDAPIPALKHVQRAILHNILSLIPPSEHSHGFVRDRSILSNAREHVAQEVVVHLDIQDFFHSVNFGRVFGLFRSQGFFRQEAAMLARLTTWQRRLPQGAPTSPAIATLVCYRLDRRLAGLAAHSGAKYTRYADDMTISGPDKVRKLIPMIRKIVEEEGFQLAEHKLAVQRPHRQQRVTGLVVNNRVSVPRKVRRRVRAIVHNCARRGIAHENPENDPLFTQRVRGYVEWIRSVHPEEGERLLAEWQAAQQRR